jgi:DNA polymerase III epsilon subunit-like protein
MYEVVDNKVGESMQVYCNPEYKSDSEMAPMALKKHKLRVEFLKGHKTFAENYEAIRDFIADSELICFGNVQKKLGTLAEYVEAPFDFAALNKECRTLASRSSRTRRQTSMRSLSCRGAAQMESCVFIWMAASSERMRTQRLR